MYPWLSKLRKNEINCVALLRSKVIFRSCMIQLKGAFFILYFGSILYYIIEINYIKSQTLLINA